MDKRFLSYSKISLVLIMALVLLTGCNAGLFKSGYSESEIEAISQRLYQEYIGSISNRKKELESGEITIGNVTMKHSFSKIGKPGANGYPLYIALRGGGVNDEKLSDDEWKAMSTHYKSSISSGIYVAPRCFIAYYDEHYRPESFLFYDRIIEDAIAFYNVDPNRVYILGFSSGGDGVYQVAPHMADRFAGANMSAGYPHERRVGNLYNLPFCIQMGELDSAYDRNILAAEYDGLLNEAAERYGGGFYHTTYIHVNGSHNNWYDNSTVKQAVYTGDDVAKWLKNPSQAKISRIGTDSVLWLNQFTRDPYPQKVVWDTDVSASLRRSQAFYWLDRDGGLTYSHIVASYSKDANSVNIEECDATAGTLKVYLNPEMLNINHRVKVEVLGKNYYVKPIVSEQIMESTLYARGDKNYMFTSEIDIAFDKDGNVVSVKAVDRNVTDYSYPEEKPLFSWSDTGLFYVDESLFGLSPNELSDKLRLDLPKTVAWDYDGYNLKWTYYNDPCGQTVIFMFQNNRCVIIYSEKEGVVTQKLKAENDLNLGEFVNGDSCKHYIDNNVYDGVSHIKQAFIWRYYEEWKNMYGTLAI